MRIAQVLGGHAGGWGDVVPSLLQKGCGGRETALLCLAREWAALGHEVDCYVPMSGDSGEEYRGTPGTHRYLPIELAGMTLANRRYDAVLAWEDPSILSYEGIRERQDRVLLGMQCSSVPHDTEEYLPLFDSVVVLSDWHGDLMREQYGDELKTHTIHNGVELYRYEEAGDCEPRRVRDGKHFYYASSPDRGLHHLLRVWPRIREEYPNSVLHVCYGAAKWAQDSMWAHVMQGEIGLAIAEGMRQMGVLDRGVIGKEELARLQMNATAMLYPCDPMSPTETGCIAIMEAGAAFTPVVTTTADCLESEFAHCTAQVDLPFRDDEFVEKVVETVDNANEFSRLALRGRQLAEERGWDRLSASWITHMAALTEPVSA